MPHSKPVNSQTGNVSTMAENATRLIDFDEGGSEALVHQRPDSLDPLAAAALAAPQTVPDQAAAPSPTIPRHPYLLGRDTCALVVVDMQAPFLNAIFERERLTQNVLLLCRAAALLNIPAIATVQYANAWAASCPKSPSAAEAPLTSPRQDVLFLRRLRRLFDALAQTGRKQVLLCGLETHICVSQTAHDLLHAGYQVHVAADAVSSRTVEKHKLGMERIATRGAPVRRRGRRLRMAARGRNARVQGDSKIGAVKARRDKALRTRQGGR
jgi:nicotinamidase-related amidase